MAEETTAARGPVTLWRKLGAAGLLLLLVAFAIAAHTWKSGLHVREIAVEGNDIVAEATLRQLSGIRLGAPLFALNLNGVRAHLLENPCIKDASVERDAPGRIVLTVVERIPVAAAVGTRLQFLDEEGFVMPAIPSGKIIDVPVLSGTMFAEQLKPGKRITSPHILNALELAKNLQEMEGVNLRISEVYVRSNGEIVLFTAEGGIPVFVGTEDYPIKLLSFQAFWEQVVLRDDVRRLQQVDVRFRGQVIARWDGAGRKQSRKVTS